MKLLVHQHIYYHGQVDFIIKKLKNITDCEWDLYVTYAEYNEETECKIKKFKPETHFIQVKNVGYDIWPFIVVLRGVELKDYDYVLKLHTKSYYKQEKFFNEYTTIGYGWRDTLYNTYLFSKHVFKNNLKKLVDNPNLGMVVNKHFFLQFGKYWHLELPEETYLMDALKERLGINSNYDKFIAGTMFLAKANIFEKLRNSDIQESNFSVKSTSNTSGSLAHVLERVFCILADDKGYEIAVVENKEKYDKFRYRIFSVHNTHNKKHKIIQLCGLKFKIKCNKNENSLVENIFSVKNNGIHKVITIFGLKFKVKSKRLIEKTQYYQLEQEYHKLITTHENTKQELSEQIEKITKEYNEYKQAQVIDKQEADRIRGEVYKHPINMDADDPRVYSINWIKENSKVLDVGCACGELGEKLKELKQAEVIGLEYNTQSIEIAIQTNGYTEIIQCDLNKYKNIPLDEEKFDYIVCGDILEHIYDPQNVINHLKQYLNDDGYFLLSIPNIAHSSIKANLLMNNFDYTQCGLLDQTHIRFFTFKTVLNFLSDLNLEIDDCKLTHYMGINGLQPSNPYPELPQEIREFILKDKHSSIIQYVVKCKKSNNSDVYNINSEKIQSELDKTPYMQGVKEYLKI